MPTAQFWSLTKTCIHWRIRWQRFHRKQILQKLNLKTKARSTIRSAHEHSELTGNYNAFLSINRNYLKELYPIWTNWAATAVYSSNGCEDARGGSQTSWSPPSRFSSQWGGQLAFTLGRSFSRAWYSASLGYFSADNLKKRRWEVLELPW